MRTAGMGITWIISESDRMNATKISIECIGANFEVYVRVYDEAVKIHETRIMCSNYYISHADRVHPYDRLILEARDWESGEYWTIAEVQISGMTENVSINLYSRGEED